jgi:hypothetical protein
MPGSMPQEPAFTEDQKQYLEGFIAGIARKSGIRAQRAAQAVPAAADGRRAELSDRPRSILRQDRAVANGGKLVPEELAKTRKSPLTCGTRSRQCRFRPVSEGFVPPQVPRPLYVAPNQDAFMPAYACRVASPSYQARARRHRPALRRGSPRHHDPRQSADPRDQPLPDPVLEAVQEPASPARRGADNICNPRQPLPPASIRTS